MYMLARVAMAPIRAQFGLPYVYAHFINPDNLETALRAYRTHFRPSRFLVTPRVMMAVSALAADSEEEAQYFSKPRNIWAAQLFQNRAGPCRPWPSRAYQPTEDEALIDMIAKRGLAGTAPQVLERLIRSGKEHGIDEFFLLTLTPDATIRKNSYTLMAQQLASTGRRSRRITFPIVDLTARTVFVLLNEVDRKKNNAVQNVQQNPTAYTRTLRGG